MKKTVYLSLGSNIGDRAANLRQAVRHLAHLGEIIAVSSLYETEPVGVEQPQPWFLNCVVEIETELMPKQLLSRTQTVEQAMGRRQTERRAPRTIDIDIVLFGSAVVQTSELTIPHPTLHQRRFVLEPLAEVAPGVQHPVLKRTAKELLAALSHGAGAVRKLHEHPI